MSKTKQLNVRMDIELYAAIQEVSKAEDMTMTDLVTPILQRIFQPDHERFLRIVPPLAILDDEAFDNAVVAYGGEG